MGYAGWAFDYVFGTRSTLHDSMYGPAAAERYRRDRDSLREILGALIASNPETLFLLRPHPGVVNVAESELAGPRAAAQRADAPDAASRSPTASASATCGRPTIPPPAWRRGCSGSRRCLINPSGGDFRRSGIYLGSPIFSTHEEVDAALRTHRATGAVPGFAEKEQLRQEVVTENDSVGRRQEPSARRSLHRARCWRRRGGAPARDRARSAELPGATTCSIAAPPGRRGCLASGTTPRRGPVSTTLSFGTRPGGPSGRPRSSRMGCPPRSSPSSRR